LALIIKFVLKNFLEKKFRTFLIIFSITVATALFFATSAISGTMGQMFVERMRSSIGSADIVIHSGPDSPSSLFTAAGANICRDRLEYSVGLLWGSGFYQPGRQENVRFNLLGIELADLQVFNPIAVTAQADLTPFRGRKAIISRLTAERYGLRLGGNLTLEVNGSRQRFVIAGIAEPTGPFFETGQNVTAVVSLETLRALYGAAGRISTLYLKVKDPAEEQAIIAELSGQYSRYTVRETLTGQEIANYVGGITTAFSMMMIVVLFMSVFIIYTSFKLITAERMPVIGTFRSVGATRRDTGLVLTAESTLYGVMGGLLGAGGGIGILYVIAVMSMPRWLAGIKPSIYYTPGQLLTAFGMALLLSLGSSLLPIFRASGTPLKEIIFTVTETRPRRRYNGLLLGIAFLAIGLLAPPFIPKQLALVLDAVCIILAVTAIVLLVPYVTDVFIVCCERLYSAVFGNEGVLAAKNLRENTSILNSIALLAIGISSFLMINTVSYSVVTEVADFYNRSANFDIMVYASRADAAFLKQLRRIDGVKGVYGSYQAGGVELAGRGERIGTLEGIDINQYPEYWNANIEGDSTTVLTELAAGRNILLTATLREKFGVNRGDTLVLETERGKKEYTVTGFFDSMMNNGNYALIPEQYFKTDWRSSYFSDIYIKTDEPAAVVAESIKQELVRRSPWIMTMDEMEQRNYQSNKQLFDILQGFTLLTLLIGICGVMNNLILSYIQRKRFLAIFRSVGMSRTQIVKLLLLEAGTGGLIGGIVGAGGGLLVSSIIPHVLKAMNRPIPIHFSLPLFAGAVIAGLAVTLLASVSPALRSFKLNIIEEIKYE